MMIFISVGLVHNTFLEATFILSLTIFLFVVFMCKPIISLRLAAAQRRISFHKQKHHLTLKHGLFGGVSNIFIKLSYILMII